MDREKLRDCVCGKAPHFAASTTPKGKPIFVAWCGNCYCLPQRSIEHKDAKQCIELWNESLSTEPVSKCCGAKIGSFSNGGSMGIPRQRCTECREQV